tara:strand:+ start:99 stop:587 length:489 start_codon:yes stop_codon:yes gene_type:complete
MEDPVTKYYDDYGNEYIIDNSKPKWCLIQVEFDDHTYVAGTMYTELKEGKPMEPYKYYQKAEESDPIGSHTKYYPSDNKFLVIDANNNLIRIVETSTCRSDDRIVYTIQDNEIIRIDERYKGLNELNTEYFDGKVSNFTYTRRQFGIAPKIGDLSPTIENII